MIEDLRWKTYWGPPQLTHPGCEPRQTLQCKLQMKVAGEWKDIPEEETADGLIKGKRAATVQKK